MQKEKSQIKNLKIFFQTNNKIIFGIFGITHWLPRYLSLFHVNSEKILLTVNT